LKEIDIGQAYCESCKTPVKLKCPKSNADTDHPMHKEQQKGVDVGIATLMLAKTDKYDTLILSSGDGDLLDAVEHVVSLGKQFELVVFGGDGKETVSTELQSRADRVYWINDFVNDVTRDKSGPKAAAAPG
ncbi:MAG: NYN domain-containing protein, partial [Planctomycetota bacterium]